jgi:hypothetical protein
MDGESLLISEVAVLEGLERLDADRARERARWVGAIWYGSYYVPFAIYFVIMYTSNTL